MRRILTLFMLLCVLPCAACTRTDADLFAPFRGGFSAELDGQASGVAFAALLTVAAPDGDGARAATLTFYAPEGLKGATLTRDATGTLTLGMGDWTMADVPVAELEKLLDLFPTAGEVHAAEVTDTGLTRVSGEGFVLELRADGTPVSIETPSVRATVVSWCAQ